ncbi:unnamed protein product [Orchesella dallaii]|uniref:Uncharacterized protein n=1 Tax=Orchesella dallaii TaxID=48710 RepID=A0ABP1RIJ5_9HEXA
MDSGKTSSKYNSTEAARTLLNSMGPSDRETVFLKRSEKDFSAMYNANNPIPGTDRLQINQPARPTFPQSPILKFGKLRQTISIYLIIWNMKGDITDWEDVVVFNDDVSQKMPDKSKQMICYHCPTKEIGTFTNIEKF